MNWIQRILHRRRIEAGMREEMEFHRAARATHLAGQGLTRAEAARRARMEFGSTAKYEEECRSALGYRVLDIITADARFTLRSMRKSPGFFASVVTILALAIGVNGALFSVFSNYAWQPLAIRGADRHYAIVGSDRNGRSTHGWTTGELDALEQAAPSAIEGIYTADTFQSMVVTPVQRQVMITSVSTAYFPLLGGTAAAGRVFSREDERQPVAVLSHAGAAKLFPAGGEIPGRTMRLHSTVFTIIGVAPPAFLGAEAVIPDFWIPVALEPLARGQASTGLERNSAFAMLAADAPRQATESRLTAAAAGFSRPGEVPVTRMELRRHQSAISADGEAATAALLIFAAFWAVLVIACANLANLYLTRCFARRHEIQMRHSLGASRQRIVVQLIHECLLTALLGAAAGSLIAYLTVDYAHRWAMSWIADAGLTMRPIQADWKTLAYAMLLGAAASLFFGLMPALQVTSANPQSRPRRMRMVLIASQAAASVVLLIIAGVLIRNVVRLNTINAGYDVTRTFDLRLDQPSPAAISRIATVPGVGAVTAVARVPLYGRLDVAVIEVNGRTSARYHNFVDERYFDALRLPVVGGRLFTASEAASAAKVAVVSRATAMSIGQTFRWNGQIYEVIGIVPDVVSGWIFEGPDSSAIYLPAAAGSPAITSVVARLDAQPQSASARIREVCSQFSGCEPVSLRNIAAMQQFPFQVAAAIAGTLGSLAMLLTIIGLYSVASYAVTQRRREIGIHLALGAPWRQLVSRIFSEVWVCLAIGVGAGLLLSLPLSKLASNTVFRIQTFDPGVYSAVPALLLLVATAACVGPARRALRTDPMKSLRPD